MNADNIIVALIVFGAVVYLLSGLRGKRARNCCGKRCSTGWQSK